MRGTGIAVAVLLLGSGLPAQTPTSAELRERAADLAYNLDYPEALATLREAVAADPRDPASAPHSSRAEKRTLYRCCGLLSPFIALVPAKTNPPWSRSITPRRPRA